MHIWTTSCTTAPKLEPNHFQTMAMAQKSYKEIRVALTLCYTKSLQSCLTLCDPIDGSPPGSLVPGILQARTLEWAAISFSYTWNWKVKVKSLSHVQLLATPWTAVYPAPPSMGFSRQEYWSGVPLPSPTLVIYTCKIYTCNFLMQLSRN